MCPKWISTFTQTFLDPICESSSALARDGPCYTVMTPGYRGGVCVAIVLFMTFVANGAVPESPKGKQEHRKTTDASKDSITVPRNSRAASSKAQLTFSECCDLCTM